MLLRVLRELASCASQVKYLVSGKRSPLTSVVPFHKGVTTWMDKSYRCNLSGPCKAFDIVPYNILLTKLERNGFEGYTVQWIRNWLDAHIQRGVINGSEVSIALDPRNSLQKHSAELLYSKDDVYWQHYEKEAKLLLVSTVHQNLHWYNMFSHPAFYILSLHNLDFENWGKLLEYVEHGKSYQVSTNQKENGCLSILGQKKKTVIVLVVVFLWKMCIWIKNLEELSLLVSNIIYVIPQNILHFFNCNFALNTSQHISLCRIMSVLYAEIKLRNSCFSVLYTPWTLHETYFYSCSQPKILMISYSMHLFFSK